MESAKLVLEFIQALIWPAFAVFLVLVLRRHLESLLKGSALTSVKLPGGVEIGLAQLASAAAAGVAIGKQADGVDAQSATTAVQTVTDAVVKATRPTGSRRGKILWVDDVPANNQSLVSAFQALEYSVVLARSTEQGLAELVRGSFDLVISDMGRPPDDTAGLTLMREMKERGFRLPMIIFAAGWARANKGQEAEYGFAKITNDAGAVYATVIDYMSGGDLRSI